MITKVISRDGKTFGRTTGGERHCQIEGCKGTRLGVLWSDGKLTFPCTKGMDIVQKDKTEFYKII